MEFNCWWVWFRECRKFAERKELQNNWLIILLPLRSAICNRKENIKDGIFQVLYLDFSNVRKKWSISLTIQKQQQTSESICKVLELLSSEDYLVLDTSLDPQPRSHEHLIFYFRSTASRLGYCTNGEVRIFYGFFWHGFQIKGSFLHKNAFRLSRWQWKKMYKEEKYPKRHFYNSGHINISYLISENWRKTNTKNSHDEMRNRKRTKRLIQLKVGKSPQRIGPREKRKWLS